MSGTVFGSKKKQHGARVAGFTLIELMIVVALIALLISISYPGYRKFSLQSNRSDAQVLLLRSAQALERYFTENNTYVGATINTAAATDIWGNGGESSEGYYDLTFTAGPSLTGYTLQAAAKGRQINDSACQNLTLAETGAKAPAICWD